MSCIRFIATWVGVGAGLLGLAGPLELCGEPSSSPSGDALTVLHLADGESPMPATVQDLAWLEGRRIGAAFGGEMEEIWSRPANGEIAGLVRLSRGESVLLYEVAVIRAREDSLVMHLKHLAPDLGVWAGGDDLLEFPLVKVEGQTAYFDGVTYHRGDGGELTILLEVTNRSGETRVETFVLRPMPLVEGAGH